MKHFLYLAYSEDSLNRKSFETSTDCETRQFVIYQLLELYQKFESCLALFFQAEYWSRQKCCSVSMQNINSWLMELNKMHNVIYLWQPVKRYNFK